MSIPKSITCLVEEFAAHYSVHFHLDGMPSITSSENAKLAPFNCDFRAEWDVPFPLGKRRGSYALASVKNIIGIELFLLTNPTTHQILLLEQLGGPLRTKGILEPIYEQMMKKLSAPLHDIQQKTGGLIAHPWDFKYKRLFVFSNRIAFNLSDVPDFGMNQQIMTSVNSEEFDISLTGDSRLFSLDGWARLTSERKRGHSTY